MFVSLPVRWWFYVNMPVIVNSCTLNYILTTFRHLRGCKVCVLTWLDLTWLELTWLESSVRPCSSRRRDIKHASIGFRHRYFIFLHENEIIIMMISFYLTNVSFLHWTSVRASHDARCMHAACVGSKGRYSRPFPRNWDTIHRLMHRSYLDHESDGLVASR